MCSNVFASSLKRFSHYPDNKYCYGSPFLNKAYLAIQNKLTMKTIHFFLITSLLTVPGCQRHLSPAEVKDNLEKAMAAYLIEQQGGDTSRLKFKMEDVNYFEDKDFYECEFSVRLFRQGGADTTGLIKGRVSKDFSKVTKK